MSRLPTLLDFVCTHPGCGARKGIRCTYSGWRYGHPIRQQRVLQVIDRNIAACKSARRRDVLVAHRAEVVGAMRLTAARGVAA